MLREKHDRWQIGEKRLRRLRQELVDEGEKPLRHKPGFNYEEIRTSSGVKTATIWTREGEQKVTQINEDGKEVQIIPGYGVIIETGRRFTKDSEGEWVLAD